MGWAKSWPRIGRPPPLYFSPYAHYDMRWLGQPVRLSLSFSLLLV
ncbi:hypothetical protein HRbin23_01366 [bacterium HR23]|nr:hypothetical protein HRbin23_01366 [bacterium HR23]